MKNKFSISLFLLIIFTTTSHAQSEEDLQQIKTVAENYMEAIRVSDFHKAAQYGNDNTRREMIQADSVFKTYTPKKQREEKRRLQNGKYVAGDIEINGDSASVNFEWEPGKKGTPIFFLYSSIYLVKTNGKWLIETLSFDETIDRDRRKQYRDFKELFAEMPIEESFRYSYNIKRDQTLPIWDDEFSASTIYPLEKLENYRGMDLLVVRYENPQEENDLEKPLTYTDYLLIGQNENINLKEKILLAKYDSLEFDKGFNIPYFFDGDTLLHVYQISARQFDSDNSCYYTQADNLIYKITDNGELNLEWKESNNVMRPEDYETFKRLFPDIQPGQQINQEEEILLGKNPFLQTNQLSINTYPIAKLENYRGRDLFIFRQSDGFESSFSDNIINFRDYIKIINPSFPQEESVISQLGADYVGEGGTSTFSYYVDTDSTIVINRIDRRCCSDTGYHNAYINSDETSRYDINSKGELIKTEVMQHFISSDFFDLAKLSELKDIEEDYYPYPRKEYPECVFNDEEITSQSVQLFFYVDKSKTDNLYVCFFSKNNKDQVIDCITVCQKKDKPKELLNKTGEPVSPQLNIKHSLVIIQTSEGDIEFRLDGTFNPIKKK